MHKRLLCALVLAAIVPALAVAQTYPLVQSPTQASTFALFGEASDQYLDVVLYGKVTNPIFMLKLGSPTPSSTASPYEIGLGGRVGAFYAAGYYAFNSATIGLLAGDKSVSQSTADVLIMDATGTTIVGKTSTVRDETLYNTRAYQDPILLFGMNIGSIRLGARNEFTWSDNSQYGTFDTAGVASTSVATTVSDISGTTYVPTFIDSQAYGVGKKAQASWRDELQLGASLPLGPLSLYGRLSVGAEGDDNGRSYSDLHKVINTAIGYPSYTPTLDLPGVALAAQADVQSWDAGRFEGTDNPFILRPGLSASVEYPFSCFGSPATATGGLIYSGAFYLRSAALVDQAGADLSVSGHGDYFHGVSYSAAPAGGFIATSAEDFKTFNAYDNEVESNHSAFLPLSMVVKAGPAVSFGVGFTPSATFGSASYDFRSVSRTVTVLDNGDGNPAATDPADTTTVVLETAQPYTLSTDSFRLSMNATAGVQIFLKPDTIRLNLGVGSSMTPIDRSTTTKAYTGMHSSITTVTSAGVDTVTDSTVDLPDSQVYSSTVEDGGLASVCSYQAGITWFVNPNATFDFIVVNPRAFNLGSTTDNGGFLNLANWSIQLTIKLPPQASAGTKE